MKKIMINGCEFEFDNAFVDRFEKVVMDSFPRCAEEYLRTNYKTDNLDEVFAVHTPEEIKDVVTKMATMEIRVYGDFFTE